MQKNTNCFVIGDIHSDISVFYQTLILTKKVKIDEKKLRLKLKMNLAQFEEEINKCDRNAKIDDMLKYLLVWDAQKNEENIIIHLRIIS